MTMQKWDYRILVIPQYLGKDGARNAEDTLIEWGSKGWELVSSNVILEPNVVCFVHHMKRPIEWESVVGVMKS